MNKILGLLLLATFGLLPVAQADPVLDRLTASLSPLLEKLVPKAGMGASEQNLVASYAAKPYKVPDRSMTGEVSGKVHDEIGPGPTGFVLSVSLQPKGTVNQAATPQTLNETFWKTDLEVTPIAGTESQVYWSLSYGAETDPKLLSRLREVMRELGREAK